MRGRSERPLSWEFNDLMDLLIKFMQCLVYYQNKEDLVVWNGF